MGMNIFADLDKYSSKLAAITETSEKISYKDLLTQADILAKNIKKRCLVFFLCKNSFESLFGYIGLMRAGAAVLLINNSVHKDNLKYLLNRYKPEFVYTPFENSEQLNFETIISFKDYLLFKTNYIRSYEIHDEIALLLSTSGTTGKSKFVKLSHKNIFSNSNSIIKYLSITDEDRPITTMPMAYSYGLSIINSHLLSGASIVLNDSTFLEKKFWISLKRNKATTFGGVPFLFQILKKLRFEEMSLPSLKYITQAGGNLGKKLSSEFINIFHKKKIKFFIMYGQTEASPRMSYLPWEFAKKKSGSIGIPIPEGRIELEDKNGKCIKEANIPGELIYFGDNVSLGYLNEPRDLSIGDINKGILRTGDIAIRDRDGFYYIVGRKKRFVKLFGKRINLDTIEREILELGYECACTGEDDKLVIHITDNNSIGSIKKHLTEKAEIDKRSVSYLVQNNIPRNKAGKVLYSKL